MNPISVLDISKSQLTVLQKRYLARDEKGKVIETPQEMFERIASAVAEAEREYAGQEVVDEWREKFLQIMTEFKFMPNTPCLINAGRPLGMLSACFVLDIEDNIDSIFDTVKEAAKIHKAGGGTGFNFSKLRPKNDIVASTGGIASGPVSFMRVFDAATAELKQGGVRRGANMGILRCDHPDIEEFIECKITENAINNFNISVGITEKFMDTVLSDKVADKSWDLVFNDKVYKTVNVDDLFYKIAECAHAKGEPGLVFLDRMNEDNYTEFVHGPISATNPCGEQPLHSYDSCNLGSIDVSKFVTKDGDKTSFDYDALYEVIQTAVRFLDNVITVTTFPLPEIEKRTLETRRIGLGIMGFADLLIAFNKQYDSDHGRALAHDMMSFMYMSARDASEELAKEKERFPLWDKIAKYYDNHSDRLYDVNSRLRYLAHHPRRNSHLVTIAPTGTRSLAAGCSQGIEPLFDRETKHKVLEGEELVVKRTGNFKTANEIHWRDHISMQAHFQEYNDTACSKTINMPSDATIDDIYDAYLQAYQAGCRGLTVYRDGCREVQVLNSNASSNGNNVEVLESNVSEHVYTCKNPQDSVKQPEPEHRPNILPGHTPKFESVAGTVLMTMNEEPPGELFETVFNLGKGGTVAASLVETIGRLCSLWLRSGGAPKWLVKSMIGISDGHGAFHEGEFYRSIPDGIAKTMLKMYVQNGNSEPIRKELEKAWARCPDCGDSLHFTEGCAGCTTCGYSKCG